MNELKRRAIALLARREHTGYELQQKLAALHLGTADEIDAVIDELQRTGLQSDARAAQAWVRAKAARFGVQRLRHDLRRRGVAEPLIEVTLATREKDGEDNVNEMDEVQRACSVLAKKFMSAPTNVREWAKQARFLQGRGFATDIVRLALKTRQDVDGGNIA